MILNLIKGINSDCDFVSSINESSFIEQIKTHQIKEDYYNFLFCILDNYDLILLSCSKEEKKILFKQRVMEISSRIDEDSVNFYDNMNYNVKTMKKKLIQSSLHLSAIEGSKGKYNISSLYYMNDLFKIHFVFVDLNRREYYETTNKNYNKIYLCLNKNRFYLSDNISENIVKKDIEHSIFNIDVKKVYETYLGSMSKYKIDDLREIATKLDIPLKADGKNKTKTKNILYNEINMYHHHL
jgi:hypothetical protein